MKEKGISRTSIRINEDLINKFTMYAEKNGMTRTSCLNMLVARYVRECEMQEKVLEKLASSETVSEILNNLTPETIEMLKGKVS